MSRKTSASTASSYRASTASSCEASYTASRKTSNAVSRRISALSREASSTSASAAFCCTFSMC